MLYTSILLNFLVSLLLIKYQWKLNKGVIYLFIIMITVNVRQISLLLLNQHSHSHELALLFLHLDPLVCLMGPAVIYYFFSLVKGKIEADNKILLFIIPALLTFINLLPYYGIPFSEKIVFIQKSSIFSFRRFYSFPIFVFKLVCAKNLYCHL